MCARDRVRREPTAKESKRRDKRKLEKDIEIEAGRLRSKTDTEITHRAARVHGNTRDKEHEFHSHSVVTGRQVRPLSLSF